MSAGRMSHTYLEISPDRNGMSKIDSKDNRTKFSKNTYVIKDEFEPAFEVLARLAEAFSENSSLKKTHLHLVSRTDWDSFDMYLEWLLRKNYVERTIVGKEEKYRLTPAGRETFMVIAKLKECIRSEKPIPAS